MSDEKQAPRLKVGSVWRVEGLDEHVAVSDNSPDSRGRVEISYTDEVDGKEYVRLLPPTEIYRLATDLDLFATGTYEEEPKEDPPVTHDTSRPEASVAVIVGEILGRKDVPLDRERIVGTLLKSDKFFCALRFYGMEPKAPGQRVEIDLEVSGGRKVAHLSRQFHQLAGYIRGYKDAIAGKPAHFKIEETTPCDE